MQGSLELNVTVLNVDAGIGELNMSLHDCKVTVQAKDPTMYSGIRADAEHLYHDNSSLYSGTLRYWLAYSY